MNDEKSLKTLEKLAKTNPEDFLNYWRGTLTAEEYDQLLLAAWRDHLAQQWTPNPVYRRLHLKTMSASQADHLLGLADQVNRGLRSPSLFKRDVIDPQDPTWETLPAPPSWTPELRTEFLANLSFALGVPPEHFQSPKAPDETPRDPAGDSLD